jgi:hypothetical protein
MPSDLPDGPWEDLVRPISFNPFLRVKKIISLVLVTIITLYWKVKFEVLIVVMVTVLLFWVLTICGHAVSIFRAEDGNSTFLEILVSTCDCTAGVAQSVQCLTTDSTAGVRSPTEAEDFSSNLCVQTGSGAHPASCTVGTGGPLSGGKARPGRDADRSPPSSAEGKKE